MGCSPLYEQSLIGIIVPPAITPMKDFAYKREYPKVLLSRAISTLNKAITIVTLPFHPSGKYA